LDDVCIFDCESVYDCMINLFFALAYPFVGLVVMCVVFSFAMIINLLMWAEVRNTHGHQGDGGSAA